MRPEWGEANTRAEADGGPAISNGTGVSASTVSRSIWGVRARASQAFMPTYSPTRRGGQTLRVNLATREGPRYIRAFPNARLGAPVRTRSSAGEHYVDIVGVAGSIPAASTTLSIGNTRRYACGRSAICTARISRDTTSIPDGEVSRLFAAPWPLRVPHGRARLAAPVNIGPDSIRGERGSAARRMTMDPPLRTWRDFGFWGLALRAAPSRCPRSNHAQMKSGSRRVEPVLRYSVADSCAKQMMLDMVYKKRGTSQCSLWS